MDKKKELKKIVSFIKRNWDKIPDENTTNLSYHDGDLISGLERKEDHIVVLLLDRQKPSVEQSYDFDEERLGVNRKGMLIWGFDSGCSCPTPWEDSYPECYNVSRKVFEIKWEEFDPTELYEVIERNYQNLKEIINNG